MQRGANPPTIAPAGNLTYILDRLNNLNECHSLSKSQVSERGWFLAKEHIPISAETWFMLVSKNEKLKLRDFYITTVLNNDFGPYSTAFFFKAYTSYEYRAIFKKSKKFRGIIQTTRGDFPKELMSTPYIKTYMCQQPTKCKTGNNLVVRVLLAKSK